VLLLGCVLFGHRVTRGSWLALAVSYAGVLLVFGHELRSSPAPTRLLGAALVFGSASATRSTWSTAARRCSAWARCG
jgi:drug/metabolite transporter (DMT)-like permease